MLSLNAQWNIWSCACILAAAVIDEHHLYYISKSCCCSWLLLQFIKKLLLQLALVAVGLRLLGHSFLLVHLASIIST
jgi:hypothetical protein